VPDDNLSLVRLAARVAVEAGRESEREASVVRRGRGEE